MTSAIAVGSLVRIVVTRARFGPKPTEPSAWPESASASRKSASSSCLLSGPTSTIQQPPVSSRNSRCCSANWARVASTMALAPVASTFGSCVSA